MSWRSEVIETVESRSKYGKYMRVNCPACLERVGRTDHDKSISVNLSSGWWKCWRCNWRGRLDGYEDDNEDTDGWEDVAEAPPLEQPSSYAAITKDGKWNTHTLLRKAVEYAIKRGISPQVAQEAELGYAYSGAHRNRLVMPVLGPFGWVGWTARWLGSGTNIKYRSSSNFDRNRNLYGPVALQDFVILTEGPVDCLRVWPYGLATMGKPTLEQLNHLIRRLAGRKLVVCLDGDSWREGIGLVKLLATHDVKASALVLPPKSDPGGAPSDAVLQGARMAAESGRTVDLR